MIGLDTNVLVRFLTHDDPGQTATVAKFMGSLSSDSPGFISLVVVVELVWVLEASYQFKRDEIEHVLDTLLRSKELMIERAEIVEQALRKFSAGKADLAGCIIERSGHAAECEYTLTFDRKAAAAGMRLLQ